MKHFIIALFLLGSVNLWSQDLQDSILTVEIFNIQKQLEQQIIETKALKDNINDLKENQELERNLISKLTETLDLQKSSLETLNRKTISLERGEASLVKTSDSLFNLVEYNSAMIQSKYDILEAQIEGVKQDSNNQIALLDSNVGSVRLNWILGMITTVLLLLIVYFLLGKRLSVDRSELETKLRSTRASLEQESLKLDGKLIEVLETQLKIQKGSTSHSDPKVDVDHTLALKVADEIIRIQKNLSRMDEDTKGLKQLNASVKRIQDNFASNGYELVDMLGKEFNEGMKVSANFIPSEDLETGKQVITRIIKPQVNYNNKMIQAAQIEVSVGE